MRKCNNQKGEGRLFSFDVLDAHGGEIRVTAFNDQVGRDRASSSWSDGFCGC